MRNDIVVGIPARDEAERIEACLIGLDKQTRCPDTVVLMLNNCADNTETIARAIAPRLGYRLDVISRHLPPHQANAGHARGLAMAEAAKHADPQAVLLTTDADAVVPPDWVARNLAALKRGADVVCGRAVIDPVEAAAIPAHLHADDALECRLIALLDELAWQLDPEAHDPTPRHTEASGASLAVWADMFDRAGGIPDVASGEDRAFVRKLWMMDARVRHDPAIYATVSGRIVGRAQGGMADAIRRRIEQQDEFTDDQVEPAQHAFRRYELRHRVRRAWGGDLVDLVLDDDLGISRRQLMLALGQPFFGGTWAKLEAISPVLRRDRVRFVDLPAQISMAESLLHQIAVPEILAAD